MSIGNRRGYDLRRKISRKIKIILSHNIIFIHLFIFYLFICQSAIKIDKEARLNKMYGEKIFSKR